jgi:Flp pilus assembly protein TadG
VLPVLVLMLWGIVEFGQGYHAKVELSAAVRAPSRTAALSSSPASVEADARTATRDAAPGLDVDAITVTVADKCPATGVGTARVVATYPHHYDIPLFGSGTWTITAKGAMRCGG